ncbi:MAG: hypothetical protein HT580_06760 [Dechloromonas sp.]|nr:MAG: hypothetical protein HT580_06760 [Dechloromonas sp.]
MNRAVAKRSLWLGNDETHYLRKDRTLWSKLAFAFGTPCRMGRPDSPHAARYTAQRGDFYVGATMTNEPKPQRRILSWATTHPTLALIGRSLIARECFSFGDCCSRLHFRVVRPWRVQMALRGFISIFGAQFKKSPPAAKLRTLLLRSFPCLGIAAFIAIAIGEFIGQLQCRGGGCAQGGIATALWSWWVSYFVTRGLSSLMLKLRWGLTALLKVRKAMIRAYCPNPSKGPGSDK